MKLKSQPSPPPEPRRELRRRQILSAAKKLVAKNGLDGLTIEALENRLDFTRGVITYHFKNKDDIINALLKSTLQEVDRATLAHVQAAPTVEEKVKTMIRSEIKGFLENPQATRTMLSFWSRVHCDSRIKKLNARLYQLYRQRAARLIKAGQLQGAFKDVSVEGLSALMVAAVVGIVCQSYFDPGAIDPETAAEEATQAILARLKTKA
ncbi:MAG: TetR/AcrR family transcriptional regulator [Elusimicrobia bacterium]|nr:TetR/AcrR family transcriptional regulator [Elusimicrobiota bacterium]